MVNSLILEGRLYPLAFSNEKNKEESVSLHNYITHIFLKIISILTLTIPRSISIRIDQEVVYVNREEYKEWRSRHHNILDLDPQIGTIAELQQELITLIRNTLNKRLLIKILDATKISCKANSYYKIYVENLPPYPCPCVSGMTSERALKNYKEKKQKIFRSVAVYRVVSDHTEEEIKKIIKIACNPFKQGIKRQHTKDMIKLALETKDILNICDRNRDLQETMIIYLVGCQPRFTQKEYKIFDNCQELKDIFA
jgi:hypothetical protein